MTENSKSALIIVFEGVEEVEALAPADVLRRAGVEVTIAGLDDDRTIEGRNGIRFLPDCALSDVDTETFDLVFLPGGPGVFPLVENESLLQLLSKRDARKQLSAAICAAPIVFAAAGILDERNATSHGSVRSDLPQPSDERIVVSDHIATSQGAGTAIEFGLKLVSLLLDSKTAEEIGASIHH